MKQLIHCIYASLAAPSFAESDIPALLEEARDANASCGISGMLLYINGSFFQVLEGERRVVDDVYGRILGDRRHSRVAMIIREPIADRSFNEWSMGFSTVDMVSAGALVGENDFFNSASCIERLDAGRAKKLLSAFHGGRWRSERTGVHRAVGRSA
jgi:hypothetical protein